MPIVLFLENLIILLAKDGIYMAYNMAKVAKNIALSIKDSILKHPLKNSDYTNHPLAYLALSGKRLPIALIANRTSLTRNDQRF